MNIDNYMKQLIDRAQRVMDRFKLTKRKASEIAGIPYSTFTRLMNGLVRSTNCLSKVEEFVERYESIMEDEEDIESSP